MALSVVVRLRHGRYDAAGPRSSQAEWPPAPARVFCALVASVQAPSERLALQWLEAERAPQVWDRGAAVERSVKSYVVTNDISEKTRSQAWPGRTNGARGRSFAVPPGDTFVVVWPHAHPSDEVVGALTRLAARVPYVGRSTSQAEVTVVPAEPDQDGQPWRVLRPVTGGRQRNVIDLGVPYPGYTDALGRAFEEGRRAWQEMRTIAYHVGEEAPAPTDAVASPFTDLMIWGWQRPMARISGDQVVAVTAALRRAVLARVADPVPAQVSGHGANGHGHVAFLALPDAGHAHADGHLLGIAIAVPRDLPAADWMRLARGVMTDPLSELSVWGNRSSLRLEYGQRLRGLQRETWTSQNGSRDWVTVTPMVADGMLRRGRRPADLAAKALVRSGYPEPVDMQTSMAALTTGAVARPRPGTVPGERPTRPVMHARVRFPVPVVGPVLAGSMRYLGLGLFIPDERRAAQQAVAR